MERRVSGGKDRERIVMSEFSKELFVGAGQGSPKSGGGAIMLLL